MNPEHEQTLERFAAGEMSVAEENDFLARCEIEPTRYRAAALALVEHRRISDALAQFSFPESQPTPAAQVASHPPRAKSRGAAFAMAAAIAAVAVGGYFLGAIGRDDAVNREFAESQPTATEVIAPAQAPPQTGGNTQIALQQDGGPAAPAASPKHDPRFVELPPESETPENQAARQLGSLLAELFRGAQREPIFSDQAKSKLRSDGWEVEEKPLIYVFSTDDGEQYAVPTHNANLRYVKP
ncbi:hypothetical protein Poly24_15710 [Rosistilla carotiformis]|uniref:Uncharacterized protein n=1 Tax=Rosistilla carotiformis TaxID=2528017 RepID=A0A518JQP5_9BACT|nr:hypothetical protein [Rosistilla carotiformis]QDV67866.1 hypothetical protein Poly24_15710 [Rosistilla carotiformis]